MKSKLHYTLKAWPVIAIATIALCYLTQLVAGWFGITLNEQANVDTVRKVLAHAFDSARYFCSAAIIVAEIVVILPAIEEVVFRWLLYKKCCDWSTRLIHHSTSILHSSFFILSSLVFSAAHYLAQHWPDNAFVALFFFGLTECYLYRKTERLWCAILNHGLFNLTNLVLLLFISP